MKSNSSRRLLSSSNGFSYTKLLPLVLVIGVLMLLIYYVRKRGWRQAKERQMSKESGFEANGEIMTMKAEEDEEGCSELVFFTEERERFRLEDLLEAAADLRRQSMCSSLYKVILNNNVNINAVYAVKRLKKVQGSCEEFGRTMWEIGKLKHPNILPLVAYSATNHQNLLIYNYQHNGTLLALLQSYIEGKKRFPWAMRLSVVGGIAKGLDFIYQRSEHNIPHGNLKPSNIVLNEQWEAMISEYGLRRFVEPERACGYSAPERRLSEAGDVYSFGVILLELLTGKTVEKSGIDLPRWVRSMVREEWTGEVFDKEVSNAAKQYAFPLLNVALKCISQAPANRPNAAEVLEKIEEVVRAHEENSASASSASSMECCVLHTVISDTWDTPGSNG